jgi:hypothetical protein
MAVDVTEERVAAAGARLRAGGWWYTPRQLYYAVCAEVETPPVKIASGIVGLGMVLILVGIIIANRTVLIAMGSVGAVLVALGVVTHLLERRPPPLSRLLALSFAEFEDRFLTGREHEGLVRDRPPNQAGAAVAPMVVCDRAATAAMLRANAPHLGDVAVVTAGEEPARVGGTRLVVLHDCDPAGCALAADLRDRGADVVDAGINPAEVLGRRVQVLEGAPARLPRDLAAHLTVEEIDWLRGGRRVEVATETPEQLVARVRAALGEPQSSV